MPSSRSLFGAFLSPHFAVGIGRVPPERGRPALELDTLICFEFNHLEMFRGNADERAEET